VPTELEVYLGKLHSFDRNSKLHTHVIFILIRTFKIFDDNGDKKLQVDEFRKGLNDYGFSYSKEESNELFNCFDVDHSGTISFDEFLEKLRVHFFLPCFLFQNYFVYI
jgi:hypothetical protein